MEKYLRGILAAFIGGGSAAAGAINIAAYLDPQVFNTSASGLPNTLKLIAGTFLLAGLSNVLHLLQRSPLPEPSPKLGLVPDSQLVADAAERKAA